MNRISICLHRGPSFSRPLQGSKDKKVWEILETYILFDVTAFSFCSRSPPYAYLFWQWHLDELKKLLILCTHHKVKLRSTRLKQIISFRDILCLFTR